MLALVFSFLVMFFLLLLTRSVIELFSSKEKHSFYSEEKESPAIPLPPHLDETSPVCWKYKNYQIDTLLSQVYMEDNMFMWFKLLKYEEQEAALDFVKKSATLNEHGVKILFGRKIPLNFILSLEKTYEKVKFHNVIESLPAKKEVKIKKVKV